MANTTTRTLRLLSLLQRRRRWPGSELAQRLGVSERTLRRDVDRLRELGYTVNAERGVEGGYRLGGTTGDAVLLLDNDEAVALAAALHAGASGTSEFAEASLGALTKVLTMLGPSQRRRAEAVGVATAFGTPGSDVAPALSHLDAIATACRDHVRLSFDYVAADGTASSRYVEPCQLVPLDTRWYLVAHDADRADWRTFRVDRMSEPTPANSTFSPRSPPASDLHAYVRFNMRGLPAAHRVVLEVDVPGQQVRDAYGTWVRVEEISATRCRVTMDADTFVWPTHIASNLDAPFDVIGPAAFRHHLRSVATRFLECAGPA